MSNLEPLLTVADIAGHMGVNEQTVSDWIKHGELRASKYGSRIGYRIEHSDYEAFLARRSMFRLNSGEIRVAANSLS